MTLPIARRRLLAGMPALPLALASARTPAAGKRDAKSLDALASRTARFFGSAARIDQINREPALRAAILRDCSRLTPEIDLKWGALEPRNGELMLRAADELAAFALRNGMKLRGHTLLWHSSVPGWAAQAMLEQRDWRLIQRYFASVIPRFGDAIDEWEVVNEPIETGYRMDGLRRNVFLEAFGPDYIRRSLEEARRFAPTARLMLNDYSLDYDLPVEKDRRYLLLRLLESLKRAGAPLDGVGIQAHLDLAKGPFVERVLEDFLREIAGFGLGIVITELDVKEADLSAPIARRDQLVAQHVRRYLDVALAQKAVSGVVTWGLCDRHSWLQQAGPASGASQVRLNRGLPYDYAMTPKPMHAAIRDAFLAASPRT